MTITYVSIISCLVLAAIPGWLLWYFTPRLLRITAIAALRMTVQTAVLGGLLWLLWHYESPWLNLAAAVVLIMVSALTTVRYGRLPVRPLLLPVAAGIAAGVALTAAIILFGVVRPVSPLSAQWLVPIIAVLTAHVATVNATALNTYFNALRTDRQTYLTQLGNGASRRQALTPYVARALRATAASTVGNLSVTCLIAIPMLLSGMLMGGVGPLAAALLLIALTVGAIAAQTIALIVTVWLADRRVFDRSGTLPQVITGGKAAAWFLFVVTTFIACKPNTAVDGVPSATETDSSVTSKVTTFSSHEQNSTAAKSTQKHKSPTVQYEIPAPLKDRPEQVLRRRAYTVSYNQDTRQANWVAWHLTKAHTNGPNQRSQEQFTEDNSVARPRATDDDYYSSRYDRGHLCPAGDNKWDATAMSESFLFTNVCPQNHALNKYEWNDVEILCREWAREYGAVDIVCGPVFTETATPKTIGRNRVRVPDALFKVVLCRSGKPKAIGFYFKNDGKKVSIESAVRTVDEIEQLTGIDFFTLLDDATEERIEAQAQLKDW